jgi:hypothetical protein
MPEKEQKPEPKDHDGAAEKGVARKPDEEQQPKKRATRTLTLDEVADLVLPGGPSEKF